ncbi:MAG: insulinase family protein, partial [Bacteroidia bacterium]|nr:insulinase family protein [Bacteroidia bacterium]
RNILGTRVSLKKFTKKHILQFIDNNYSTEEIVVCSVGRINFENLKQLINKYFGNIPLKSRINCRIKFNEYVPNRKIIKKNTHMAHCIIGNTCYDFQHKKRLGLVLLNNILGGSSLNSRLNLMLREKYGLTYSVESIYNPYSDTGIVTIYFSAAHGNLEKSMQLIYNEIDTIKTKKLGEMQLYRAKKQITGHLALLADNNANLMMSIGRSYLIYDKVDSLKQVIKEIENITADDILEIANEVFDSKSLSVLIYI